MKHTLNLVAKDSGLRSTSAPVVVRQNHFVCSFAFLIYCPLLGTLNELMICQVESVREEVLDMTCLTCRGNGKGQRLGMSQKAGVLGALVWLKCWISAGEWWGMRHGFSHLRCCPLWNESSGWRSHWGCLTFSYSFIREWVRPWCDWPHDLKAFDCKWIKGHLSITNMLVARATPKELAVLAVGIIFYLQYTTDILESFFSFLFFFGVYKQLTLGGWYNLTAQKVSKPDKILMSRQPEVVPTVWLAAIAYASIFSTWVPKLTTQWGKLQEGNFNFHTGALPWSAFSGLPLACPPLNPRLRVN